MVTITETDKEFKSVMNLFLWIGIVCFAVAGIYNIMLSFTMEYVTHQTARISYAIFYILCAILIKIKR